MGQGITSSQFFIYGKQHFTQTGYKEAEKSFVPGHLDVDMKGQVFIVTGANSGLGKEVSRFVAVRGGTVYMVCRNSKRGEKALEDIVAETKSKTVHLLIADCGIEADVRRVVQEFGMREDKLDGIVCNAGALFNNRQFTKDGVEATFALHLLFGTYLFASLVLPYLKKANGKGKVIMVSSGGMYNTGFPSWELATGRSKYNGTLAYAYAKRGQVLLAERWTEMHKDVCFVSCHPGWASTPGVDDAFGDQKKWLEPLRTAYEGAEGILWLCARPVEELKSGEFYLDRKPQRKHLGGAFFTEGSRTKNSREEVTAMLANLDKWSAGKHDLPGFWLIPAEVAPAPDAISAQFQQAVTSFAEDLPKWTAEKNNKGPEKNSKDIKVWTRSVPDSSCKAFRFETELKCTVASLEELMWNKLLERHIEWNNTFGGGKMLEKRSPYAELQTWTYQVKVGSDREFVVARQLYKEPGGALVIIERSVPLEVDTSKESGAVRAILGFNYRRMEPAGDGKTTKFTYANLTDIGGWVPGWVTNNANADISCEEIRHIEAVLTAQ